jgi:hypothetical protein
MTAVHLLNRSPT